MSVFYHFYNAFTDLAWSRSAQSKTYWLHFLPHFFFFFFFNRKDQDKIEYGVEAIQVGRPDTTFE